MTRDDEMTGRDDQRHCYRREDHDAAQARAFRRREAKRKLTDPANAAIRSAKELEEFQKQCRAKSEELKKWK